MSYINPGRLYIDQYGHIQTVQGILSYADFIHTETGILKQIPVDLERIFNHFEIPEPKSAPLSVQGLLVDAKRGIIFINSEDSQQRQKFSKAHELVELLFSELPQNIDLGKGWVVKRPGGFKEYIKEYLCNWTAANLLMPPEYISLKILDFGVSFQCANIIAKECDVSFSAALVQLARVSLGNNFVVLWRMKNKPSELRNISSSQQTTFLPIPITEPPKKLRVEWSLGGWNKKYIPKNKSVEDASLIHRAWESKLVTNGYERLTFDGRSISSYYTENLPFRDKGEYCVLSLIREENSI